MSRKRQIVWLPVRDTVSEYLFQHCRKPEAVLTKLSSYHDLLLKWQPSINLISSNTIHDIWSRHILDSLQLLRHLPAVGQGIDLGSGAGFPGMVLAIGGMTMTLIESDTRKANFLREVARITSTNVTIYHGRIESYSLSHSIDFITARACASLDALLSQSAHLISHETICLFHKGKNYATELQIAEDHWQFECRNVPSIVDRQSVILKLQHIKERI